MDHDLDTLLSKSDILNLVDSAIAIVNPQGDFEFQNNAFVRFNTSARDSVENLRAYASLFACPAMAAIVRSTLADNKESLTKMTIYYGPRMQTVVTLRVQPMQNRTTGELTGGTITLGEESIAFNNHHLARANESLESLAKRVRDLSEIKISDDRLLRMLFKKAPFAIVLMNENRQVVQMNRAAERLFGITERQSMGKTCDTFLNCFQKCNSCPLQQGRVKIDLDELTGTTVENQALPLLRSAVVFDDLHGKLIVEFFVDLAERKKAEDMLARLGRILDESTNEIYVFDADSLKYLQVNQGGRHNLNYTMDELKMLTPLDLKPEFNRQSFESLLAPLRRGETPSLVIETVHKRKDSSLYPVEVRLQLSLTESRPAFVAIVQDITERRQSQMDLHRLAHHDALTGLPNRVLLQMRLSQAMTEADQTERLVAVMFLDLDYFKTINDTLGHETGDELLRAVAGRLHASVRAGDTIARLGGDEFAIVLANVAHVDDVTGVAQKIVAQFGFPFRIGGHELFISASIGITLYPLDEGNATSLLRDADIAMYSAKELGRNRFQFYTAELNIRSLRRLELEMGLRQALERQEFVIHYQPLIDLKTGQIQGMEALLRWQHPKFGLIQPLEFIPLAEETGLIIPIGEWVLQTACAQTKVWHDSGFPNLQVAVNLSTKQLRDKNLVNVVKIALAYANLEPQYLDVELTESVLMQDTDLAAVILRELNAIGVSISLDDFGTGYSSLSYLKRFPVDYLKIDRCFVQDMIADSAGAGLVQAIIAMANVLNITVIAEGVETQDQLQLLKSYHCDIVQGFHYSKPLSEGNFSQFLQGWNSR